MVGGGSRVVTSGEGQRFLSACGQVRDGKAARTNYSLPLDMNNGQCKAEEARQGLGKG